MVLTAEERNWMLSITREALDHILTIYNENPKDWIISTEFETYKDYILSLHAELGAQLTAGIDISRRQYICNILSKYSNSNMICDWKYKKLYIFLASYGYFHMCLDPELVRNAVIREVSNSRDVYPAMIDRPRSSDNELKKLLDDNSVSLFGIPKGIFAWRNSNANIGSILDELHYDTHKVILVDRSAITINKLRNALDMHELYYEDGLEFIPFVSSYVADAFYRNPDGFIVYRVSRDDSMVPAWLMLINPDGGNTYLTSQLATICANWDVYYDDVLYENIDTRIWTMSDIIEKLNERMKAKDEQD